MNLKEAIDLAVENLITEGIIDGLWQPQGGEKVVKHVAAAYAKEVEQANKTKLYNRKFEDRRNKNSASLIVGGSRIDGDYSNPDIGYNFQLGYRYMFNNPRFNLNINGGIMEMDNKNPQMQDYAYTTDGNIEFIFLPYESISPYIYGGIGAISNKSFNDIYFKTQFGLGVEYLPTNTLGLRLYGEQNITFTDKLDGLVQGKRDDYFWRFGIGVNFYFGN